MFFAIASIAAVAAAYANVTVTSTSEVGTTVVTVTSCSENVCTEVPTTTGYVVVTDISTLYTTYCPLTSSESASSSANSTAPGVETATGAANKVIAGAAAAAGIAGALLL